MESKVVVLFCAVSAIFGLLSAVLGFAAEGTKVKSSEIIPDVLNEVCVYPSSPASGLGFASAFFLLVAFVLVNLSSGCFCCYRRNDPPNSSTPRSVCNPALVCFIFSCITFVAGFILMLVAAGISSKANMDKTRVTDIDGITIYSCNYVKPGVFAIAAVLSFISIALGITCSLNLTGGTRGLSAGPIPQPGGIAMGQAQVPPPTQQSGFAYEDNYVRR